MFFVTIILIMIVLNSVLILHPNKVVTAANMGYSNSSSIKVLFDFTKDEDAGNADWRVDGAYSSWADALRNEGIDVDSLGNGQGEIKYSDLSSYNVFVLPEPQDSFSSSERDAIVEFVQNGGGLVYIADHKGSDRNNNGYDSWSIWNDNLNFDSLFNITLLSTQSGNSDHRVTDIVSVPVLTENVSSFGTWSGTCMDPSGSARTAANQSGHSVLSYEQYSEGRVVVHCDSSTFDDGTPDSSNEGDNLYDGWSQYDDSTLAVDIILWAAGINSTYSNSTYLKEKTGTSPSVSYGDGDYIVAYKNDTYVSGYFVDSSGSQSSEIKFYRYGDGIRTAYNPDSRNFTVVSYDYYPTSGVPKYHKILNRFVNFQTSDGNYGFTVTNDANRSVDVCYGSHKLIFVWVNLTRSQIEGMFYDTQDKTYGGNFTIYIDSLKKYDVAVGYDSESNRFLVAWVENNDLKGRYVYSDGSVGNFVNFQNTPHIQESQLSLAGGNGEFMITYRNGTFSNAKGAYFILVDSNGNAGSINVISKYNAGYCGRAEVKWTGDYFMVIFSDTRNGSPDVFVRFYYSNGSFKEEDEITSSGDNNEAPSGMYGDGTMLVAWNNYVSGSRQYIEAKFFEYMQIPEFSPILFVFLLLAVLIFKRYQ